MPSRTAEMLRLAWRLSDRRPWSRRVHARTCEPHSQPELFPSPWGRMLPCQPATGLPASACSDRGELCPLP